MSKTNLALLGVVIVLAAFVAVVEKPWKGGKPEGYVERKPLFDDFDVGKVSDVILAQQEKTLELKKTGDRWVVASMNDYPANEGQITQLVSAVRQWKIEARVGLKSEDYMVDDKKGTRVTLKEDTGKVIADLVTGKIAGFDAKEAQRHGGQVDTESFGIYVRRADSQDVYFMKGLFLGTFSPDPTSYIDRMVNNFDAAKATQFSATCGDKKMSIAKQGADWAMAGLSYPPDKNAVKQIVEGFARLSAVSLEGRYEPGKYGLEPPSCTAEAVLEDGTTHAIEVGAEKPEKGYYARVKGGDFVVVISKYEVEGYRKDPTEFARKHVFGEDSLDLVSMEVTGPSGAISLKKNGDQWMLETKEVGEIEADLNGAWKLMNPLTRPEIKQWVAQGNDAAYGLDHPRLVATGTAKDGRVVTLLLGKDNGDALVYAKAKDESWIVSVPKSVLTDLSANPADLKKKVQPPPKPPAG
ncbi:MAG: DUF4340 domain-containing protein [Acidobacteriota bacterium]